MLEKRLRRRTKCRGAILLHIFLVDRTRRTILRRTSSRKMSDNGHRAPTKDRVHSHGQDSSNRSNRCSCECLNCQTNDCYINNVFLAIFDSSVIKMLDKDFIKLDLQLVQCSVTDRQQCHVIICAIYEQSVEYFGYFGLKLEFLESLLPISSSFA